MEKDFSLRKEYLAHPLRYFDLTEKYSNNKMSREQRREVLKNKTVLAAYVGFMGVTAGLVGAVALSGLIKLIKQ